MSNRILSLLVIMVIFGTIFGIYYYFSVLSTGNVSLIFNGSGSASVVVTSEFGNSYNRDCERSCLFDNIPAVSYTVSAKRDGYATIEKTFKLSRGEDKKVVIAMEKEVVLTEQTKKKEETIATIKLKKAIQETIETTTGSVVLGYRNNALYYATPNKSGWDIFEKKEDIDEKELFILPTGTLSEESLDIYEGYIALIKDQKQSSDSLYKKTSFYSLSNGQETTFRLDGKIIGVQDTLDSDTKIITLDSGVYMYTASEQTARLNPLYDDIIQLSSGEIVALVKKSSLEKQSLLSLKDTENDIVFLVGQDTRERRILLKTPKNGKMLRYRNNEILFVTEEGEILVVKNVK